MLGGSDLTPMSKKKANGTVRLGREDLPEKGGGVLFSLIFAGSVLLETLLCIKEEIQTLKKVINLLVTKVDEGLGLAQGQCVFVSGHPEMRDKGDGPIVPNKGKAIMSMGQIYKAQPKLRWSLKIGSSLKEAPRP